MGKYILKRVGLALITLFLIIFILFILVRIMPGNPFPSERMSDEQIARKRAEMGLDDPVLVQFFRYMKTLLLEGSFGNGTSLYYGVPITVVLPVCIKNSFRIGGLAVLMGTAVGLILGAVILLRAAMTFLIHWEIKVETKKEKDKSPEDPISPAASESPIVRKKRQWTF